MKSRVGVLALLGLVLLASGCVGRSMTHYEAKGLCLTGKPTAVSGFGVGVPYDDGCIDRNVICAAYFDAEGLGGMSRDQCQAHCDEAYKKMRKDHVVSGCSMNVTRGHELCGTMCRNRQ